MSIIKEVWRDLPEYEGVYQISSLGRVKSFKFNRETVLNPSLSRKGYYCITLRKNSKSKRAQVHQLVAICFLNHTVCGMALVVNHIDGDRTNNKVSNLEITTNRANSSLKNVVRTSNYVGVCWYKAYNKWRATIVINYKKVHLGYFDNELDAHNAYQDKLKSLNEQ